MAVVLCLRMPPWPESGKSMRIGAGLVRMKTVYVEKKIEVLVCSYGGTGTTMLIEFLSRYFCCNSADDEDGLKHTDRVPVSRNPNLRIVYIYCDPVDAVYSLFRRGFFALHSRKLLRGHPEISRLSESSSLEAYAREQVDRFQFEAHFSRWRSAPQYFPVFFMRFERLWDNLPELFEFLGIPATEMGKFPQQRRRLVKTMNPGADVEAGIEKLYGGFQARVAALSDSLIQEPDAATECSVGVWVRGLPDYGLFRLRKLGRQIIPAGLRKLIGRAR